MQMIVAGLGVQLYGLVSDGSVLPLVLTAGLFAAGTLATGVATFLLRRAAPIEVASQSR